MYVHPKDNEICSVPFFTSSTERVGTAIHCIEKATEKSIIEVRNRDMRFRGKLSEDSQMFRNGTVNEDE